MDGIAPNDYLTAAKGLAPLIASLRPRFDVERTLPGELVEALASSGFFSLWAPRAIGGAELDPLPFLDVIEELARLDGSVGWCTVIPAGYSRLAGALDEAVARRMFGSGRAALVGTLNPSGKAVAVAGGYRVTGRWSYGSFIAHSDWVLGNCITHDGHTPRKDATGAPEFRLAIVPRSEVEVFDVWHTGGLRGTGSNDYAIQDRFVPEEHTIPVPGFVAPVRQPGPLYTVPMPSTFTVCIATVALGIARAALEALDEVAAGRLATGSPLLLRDKPLAQAERARAEALVRAGRAYVRDELGAAWQDALAEREISLPRRAQIRLAACHATQGAIEAVDIAYRLAGGAALYESGRIERCARDVHAAGQHVTVLPMTNLELVGKTLFGLDPGTTRF
ncbi:MAG: acyl-CoA dehydrogenase family protein [Proteobacteria bacterium]|nr:acyl-CoA dehydrogenase family protein [Pseudomonadota bacterium]